MYFPSWTPLMPPPFPFWFCMSSAGPEKAVPAQPKASCPLCLKTQQLSSAEADEASHALRFYSGHQQQGAENTLKKPRIKQPITYLLPFPCLSHGEGCHEAEEVAEAEHLV